MKRLKFPIFIVVITVLWYLFLNQMTQGASAAICLDPRPDVYMGSPWPNLFQPNSTGYNCGIPFSPQAFFIQLATILAPAIFSSLLYIGYKVSKRVAR